MKKDSKLQMGIFLTVICIGFEMLGYAIVVITLIDIVKYFIFHQQINVMWVREVIGCIIAVSLIFIGRLLRKKVIEKHFGG